MTRDWEPSGACVSRRATPRRGSSFDREGLGFEERIRGSHHIFTRDGVEEILNLQPKGAKAKSYQVKQVRNVILDYRLASHGKE